jgi:tetratricopeptide (TPR) repeat protein
MAERIEEPEDQADQGAEPISPAAGIAIGLRKGRSRDKADPELDTFLREQTRLVRLQTEHLHEQRDLQTSLMRWSQFSIRMKAVLQVMTAAFGLAVAGAVGVMAWQAHEDHGVVIEAFSVPPDLAQRGLTGQVAASHLLDRLAELQQATVTARPASTYANDWGGDIKVEIPETGVSIGELNRYLRQWLGSETRISGEMVRTSSGLAVTARAGDAPGRRFEGPDADVDKLIGQAAEAVYQQTQPYRYAVYLASSGRRDEALAAYSRLAQTGASEDRAWAYIGWAQILAAGEGRIQEGVRMAEAALALDPRLAPASAFIGPSLGFLERPEDQLAWTRRELAFLKSGRAVGLPTSGAASLLRVLQVDQASLVGDYARAAQLRRGLGPMNAEGQASTYRPFAQEAQTLAQDHDLVGSRAAAAQDTPDPMVAFLQGAAVDDWDAMAPLVDRALQAQPSLRSSDVRITVASIAAPIYAHVGRFADAQALLQASPGDCYGCLRARGLIAALEGDWPAVDRWYAEAASQGPSLPFAHTDWGQALLARGDVNGAIAKLAEAHRRGPHFADPLELWGEALMRKGDYAGAIAKFAEADKDAPRWGRNHMRWGEALMLSGRYAEARAQYETANGLDLSKPDRAALNVLLVRSASGPLHG